MSDELVGHEPISRGTPCVPKPPKRKCCSQVGSQLAGLSLIRDEPVAYGPVGNEPVATVNIHPYHVFSKNLKKCKF